MKLVRLYLSAFGPFTDRVIEQALEVKAGEAEERGEEPGGDRGKETSAAGAKLARLEPVEHQPSLL